MIAIKIAMREKKNRKDMRWVIYTDSLISILAIEKNRENHQIYNILVELYKQGNRSFYAKSLHK